MEFKNLKAYQESYDLAMHLFEISRNFPKSETYALVNQIRRSSRSVCACIAEAYRKRQYPAHFKSKMSDADMENSETAVWIDFAKDCGYITAQQHGQLSQVSTRVGRRIGAMMKNSEQYL